MICYLFPEPIFFFFSYDVPALLYYAQIPSLIVALIFGFFIFLNGRKFLLNRLLFLISILFSIWTISTLIAWTNIQSNFIIFVWSFFGLILGLISIFCVYFIYVFLEKKDISFKLKIIFILLLLPILIFSSTSFNLSGFNITNCDAFNFEWLPFKLYSTFLGVLAMFWVFFLLLRKYRNVTPDFKKQIILMGVGIELFLFSFFGMEFLATYFTKIGILENSQLELYGLFSMVIFIIYVSILVIRFNAFNVKLFATQALVWGLIILIGSEFLFVKEQINIILVGVTFFSSIIIGYFLIKSVKKEIKQKEELARLNIDLQKLIQQKESLMHLINHKVKGSFTQTKYIFSEILQESFGVLSPELKKMAEFGLNSGEAGVKTVDLILNASNLQKGAIKFDMKPINLKDMISSAIEEKRSSLVDKKLQLETDLKEESYIINGDVFWLKEVINNLIDNAINYTNEGKVMVGLEKKSNKILFYVKDTGTGITEEDKKNLFTEGGRGKESVKINVNSTGYGLYSVKLIVEAHKGRVWAESEGKNKGSQFYVEFNAI